MADSFDEVLDKARHLSPEERQQLVRELSQPESHADGEQRSIYDALKARGLIGFMTDAPEDLSTNSKYMEGFGQDAR